MKEEWKEIKGFEGIYEVSNLGRIRRYLKPAINNLGYKHLALMKNATDEKKEYLLHRLVAEAFIPNPDNLPYINHKDENPSNNHVDNLEWCTQKYNVNYGTSIERRKHKRSKKIIQLTLDDVPLRIFSSLTSTKEYGFNPAHVSSCCKGKRKSHLGYKFIYA